MESRDDFVPPPPYSETDIYSPSCHSPSAPRHNADDTSVAASSSNGNAIYTPPETPRESHHNFSAAGPDDHQTSASAQAYFDSRPAAVQMASSTVVRSISVSENVVPSDFPYPDWASSRDTTEQDWKTFINYLMPDHAERANAHIIDRKLQAAATSERGIAEARLDQIRSPASGSSVQRGRAALMDTVSEWNLGFFGPRGVTINLKPSPVSIPGAWDNAFDSGNASSSAAATAGGEHERGLGESARGRRYACVGHGNGRRCGRRNRSCSSSISSSSSSSDSDSDSSIGSLPDYEDLKDSQLPVVKKSILAWLAHPDQPVTRQEVKRVKAEIRAAKSAPQPPPSSSSAAADGVLRPPGYQRQEIKKLMARWEKLKKAQKEKRRQARKEKRALRREMKKKRLAEKREQRRGRREHRRAQRDFGNSFGMRPTPGISDVVGAVMGRIQQGMQQGGIPNPPPPPPGVPGFPPRHMPGSLRGRGGFFGRGRGFSWSRGPTMPYERDDNEHQQSTSRDSINNNLLSIPRFMGNMPGAWPSSSSLHRASPEHHQNATTTAAAPPQSSRVQQQGDNNNSPQYANKYLAVDRLEAEIAAKTTALQSIQQAISSESIALARSGLGDRKTTAGAGQDPKQREMERLEDEIGELSKDVERLRLEADEEFAKVLEEEERKGVVYA